MWTAALADKGTESIIGEPQGGWFWLPPWSLWEPWAKEGLENAGRIGDFRSVPSEEALDSAKCIVVLWSKQSVTSDWEKMKLKKVIGGASLSQYQ
jgi:hypothetical protein